MALTPVPRHRLWLAVLVAGLMMVGSYFVLPGGHAQNIAYNMIGVGSGVLILYGVRLYRPSRPACWYWLAAGQLTSAAGDVVWEIYQYVLHQQPFPSLADVFYLAAYPMIGTGLVLLVRIRQGRDSAALIDAAIVATGLGMVFWVFVLHPVVTDPTGSLLESVINTAYPAADALLLAVVARLLTGGNDRNASSSLIGAGAVLLLFADIGYSLATRYLSVSAGNPLDALFLLSYVFWGVAALHPSMSFTRTSTTAPATPRVGMGRLLLLTASSLLAPALLFLPGMRTDSCNWLVVSSGAIVLFLLVAWRMAGFIRQVQHQAAQLEHLALRDTLTGLANRRQLEQDMAVALTTGAACVALLDLTGFKKVNDRLGHNTGDLLLVEVARRLSRATGDGASVARLGGDEFAVLIGGGPERCTEMAERITQALAQPIRTGDHELCISANIGLASAAGISQPLEALRRADVAMYAAKQHSEPYRWYRPEFDEHAAAPAKPQVIAADAGPAR
jgi:diguanylate cyclase (GGDEF)-like protein